MKSLWPFHPAAAASQMIGLTKGRDSAYKHGCDPNSKPISHPMNHCPTRNAVRLAPRRLALIGLFLAGLCLRGMASAAPVRENEVTVLEKEGRVEASQAGSKQWEAARTNQVLRVADRVRTGERSRATLHLLDQSTLRMFELTEFLVEPLSSAPEKSAFSLSRGLLYFFHRDKPVDVQFKTRTASAAIRGTEFHLAVDDDGRTVLTMFDGQVELTNEFGAVVLNNGEQGVVEPGRAPVKTAVIDAINIIQWCLYYPGVLDVNELSLDAAEQQLLAASLNSYRDGDLLGALAAYPADRQPNSASEKVYLAALLLSVGKVAQAEALLPAASGAGGKPDQLAAALSDLIRTVKHLPSPTNYFDVTNSATAALVRSYRFQSQSKLSEALRAAEHAVSVNPQFGFGWARVAELEFSFGHTEKALAALDQSLAFAPNNAQAVALHGFVLAAQNRIHDAMDEFDRAILLDGALGNAWLGRGLCRIRSGNVSAGRDDLLVAATLEPQRALLRSYLGKAWNEAGDPRNAAREMALAKERDPNDPTAWLYSALLLQQSSRINEAIGELEHSQNINDNRQVYRSQLLLDQDRAVRGANLAGIYRDAGMSDVSVREAGRAVNDDYANYSAHLFLANSFNDLRELAGVNLRYETPFVNEYLLANLLAPVGAGPLSQRVSQQEYSKLFQQDGLGLSSDTLYSSHGDWRQIGALSGTADGSSFSIEGLYDSEHGYRANSDFESSAFDFRMKQELAPADSLYFQASLASSSGGNTVQYYNQSDAATDPFRFEDRQNPILLLGYHHEWSPGVHTLLLGGQLSDIYSVVNPLQDTVALSKDADSVLQAVLPFEMSQEYQSQMSVYSAEAQQIFQTPVTTTIVGTRFETGNLDTHNLQVNFQAGLGDLFPDPIEQNFSTHVERWSVYGYEQWQVADPLRLIAGLTYDHLVMPENFRFAPLSGGTETSDHLLPKAGVIWTPLKDTTVRAAWSESVAGMSFDQSFQLEPSQVAGFNQAFRSLIPESVAGANAGATFTSYGASIEQKFSTRTYLAVTGELLESTVKRNIGAFEFIDFFGPTVTTLREKLDFKEESVVLSAHQLVGRDWAFGAIYRISYAQLKDNFTDISDQVGADSGITPRTKIAGTLQTLNLQAIYQNPMGMFARLNGAWTIQDNDGYTPARPGANFWQFDVFGGYRLARRRVELSVGVLNLTSQDYKLSPVNLHAEKPRERTLVSQLRFQF